MRAPAPSASLQPFFIVTEEVPQEEIRKSPYWSGRIWGSLDMSLLERHWLLFLSYRRGKDTFSKEYEYLWLNNSESLKCARYCEKSLIHVSKVQFQFPRNFKFIKVFAIPFHKAFNKHAYLVASVWAGAGLPTRGPAEHEARWSSFPGDHEKGDSPRSFP